MGRYLVWAIACWLTAATQLVAQMQQKEKDIKLTAVAELFEDGTDFLIENLDNNGGRDGSVAARNEQTFFSGTCSLSGAITGRPAYFGEFVRGVDWIGTALLGLGD